MSAANYLKHAQRTQPTQKTNNGCVCNQLTYERNSLALLHLKVAALEKRPVLVAMRQALHGKHFLPHTLYSRKSAAPSRALTQYHAPSLSTNDHS